jgi:hypothetical protein
MAYLSLVLPVPIVLYVCWRLSMGAPPFVLMYALLPLSLLGAALGLLWLRRRRWVQAVSVPTLAVAFGIGLCLLAYLYGRDRVESACEEALRLPVGEFAPVLRQMNANPDVTCAVGDRMSQTWFVRVETAGRDFGSMWFTLDDDDEFVLRRASLEPLAGRRGEEGVRGR